MRQRIVVGLDDSLEGSLGAVEDRAGREQPRPELRAGANQLRVREHRFAVVRRIVRRRHAERQIGHQRPARLREQPARFAADVSVNVDDARHDRLARDVDTPRAGRDRRRRRRSDRRDPVAFDDDGAVLDDLRPPW